VMFLITRNVAWIPLAFIVWLGTPFIWDPGHSLKEWRDDVIREKYFEAKFEHYGIRIVCIVLFVLGCLLWWGLSWLTHGYCWYIFPIIVTVAFFIDAVIMGSRFIYYQEQEKKSKTAGGTAIVLADCWKDNDVERLIARVHAERSAANDYKNEKIKEMKGGL
jgi:hypothetical protein